MFGFLLNNVARTVPVTAQYLEAHTDPSVFLLGLSTLFMIYIVLFSFVKLGCVLRYLLTGQFMVFNSPFLFASTLRRAVGAGVGLVTTTAAVGVGTVGGLQATN